MQTLTPPARALVRTTWVLAVLGTLGGQLHALARHATKDGRVDLELPLTRLWAEPAADLLAPLLVWADPDTVYVTYGKLWLPVLAAATGTAVLVYRRHRPAGFERVAWLVALTGLAMTAAAAGGQYYTPWLDASFLLLGMPGLLLAALGSTVLGGLLLRRGFRPRATGWLLLGFVPLFAGIVQVTSMGSGFLPLVWAWTLAGARLLRPAPVRVPAGPRPATGGRRTGREEAQPRAAEVR